MTFNETINLTMSTIVERTAVCNIVIFFINNLKFHEILKKKLQLF